MPGLYFESRIDFDKLDRDIQQINMKVGELADKTRSAGADMDSTFRRLGAAVAGYFSLQMLSNFGRELVSVRGEFQQLGIALETILGSKAKADALMGDITKLAAKTPFSLSDVGQGAKQLLAFQVSQEEVIDTLTRLGNISAGVSRPIGQLINVYGQVKAKGKLTGDDLRQFQEAGIPIIHELAKVLGKADEEVAKLVSDSQVGFDDVQQVIRNLTDEGGMFFNLMEKQSHSLTGMVSNLGDAFDRMLNEIGEGNEGILADGIKGLTYLVENYQQVLDILKVLVATYGAYRAALILTVAWEKAKAASAVQAALAGRSLTAWEVIHTSVLYKLNAAQKLLNTTIKANPYVAVATALTAVIGGLMLYNKWSKDTTDNNKLFADINAKVTNELEHENSVLSVYKNRILQTNPGTKERIRLVKELTDKYPDLLKNIDAENASLSTLSAKFDNYSANLEKVIRLRVLENQLSDIINQKQNLETQYKEGAIDANKRYAESLKLDADRSALLEELEYQKNLVDYGKGQADLLKEKKKIEAELAAMTPIELELIKKPQTIDEFTTEYKRLTEAMMAAGKPVKSSLEDINKAYDEYVKSLGKSNGDYASKIKRLAEINKLLQGGSTEPERQDVPYWEKKKKEAQEALDRLTRTDADFTTKQAKYLKQIDEAQKEIDFIRGKKDKGAEKELAEEASDDENYLKKLLEDTRTYEQKLADATSRYEKDREELVKRGAYGNLAVRTEQYNQEISALEEAHFRENESYKWIFDNIDRMGVEALRRYIVRLEEEVRAKEWSDEVKQQLSEKLAQAEERLMDKAPIAALANMHKRITAIRSELKTATDPAKVRSLKEELDRIAGDQARTLSTVFGDVSSRLGEASQIAGYFSEDLQTALDAASGMASAFANIASGNYIQGGLQLVGTLMQLQQKVESKRQRKEEEAARERQEYSNKLIEEANHLLDQQLQLLQRIKGVNAYEAMYNSQEALNRSLNDGIKAIENLDIQDRNSPYEKWVSRWFSKGAIFSYTKETRYGQFDFEQLNSIMRDAVSDPNSSNMLKVLSEIERIRNLIADGTIFGDTEALEAQLDNYEQLLDKAQEYLNAQNELLTGSTYDSIVQGIVNGFADGFDSAEDFAANFEELMRTAILKALSVKYIEDPVQDWYNQFAEASKDGLTDDEIAVLRSRYEEIVNNAAEYADALEKATGITMGKNDSDSSMAGAVKGIQEDTANVLVGQLNAMRLLQIEDLQVNRSSLLHLAEINNNTYQLFAMKDSLHRIEQVLRGGWNNFNDARANGR